MYFLRSVDNLANHVADALKAHFGDKAEVGAGRGMVAITVKDGFPDFKDELSEDELARGVIGGGVIHGLDGKTFKITIEEIGRVM